MDSGTERGNAPSRPLSLRQKERRAQIVLKEMIGVSPKSGAIAPSWTSSGFEIDRLLRELAQERVGLFLFLERLLEERGCLLEAKLRRPGF